MCTACVHTHRLENPLSIMFVVHIYFSQYVVCIVIHLVLLAENVVLTLCSKIQQLFFLLLMLNASQGRISQLQRYFSALYSRFILLLFCLFYFICTIYLELIFEYVVRQMSSFILLNADIKLSLSYLLRLSFPTVSSTKFVSKYC